MVKNREINGTEEIALVTPTPDVEVQAWLGNHMSMTYLVHNLQQSIEVFYGVFSSYEIDFPVVAWMRQDMEIAAENQHSVN